MTAAIVGNRLGAREFAGAGRLPGDYRGGAFVWRSKADDMVALAAEVRVAA